MRRRKKYGAAWLQGLPLTAFVDTRAELSFVSEEFLIKVQVTPDKCDEHALEVELATGAIAKVVGQVKLRTALIYAMHTFLL